MADVLKKLLEKAGVEGYEQLTDAEKATYNEWEAILNKKTSMDDVVEFMSKQVMVLNRELRRAVQEGRDRDALTAAARVENYEALIMIINEPKERRKQLEHELSNKL